MWNIVSLALNKLNINDERGPNQEPQSAQNYLSQIADKYLPMLGFEEPVRPEIADPCKTIYIKFE
jgi:hypothetical protein